VYATETPVGEAAVAVHRGPHNRVNEAHDAIGKWMVANRRESARHSWETYGDPTPDPADGETTVLYLLKKRSDFYGPAGTSRFYSSPLGCGARAGGCQPEAIPSRALLPIC
jgi:hypothetical protein